MEQLEDIDLVLVLLLLFIYYGMHSRNGALIQYRPPDVYPQFEYSLYDLPESTVQLWFR
jgi:hypothetical protein